MWNIARSALQCGQFCFLSKAAEIVSIKFLIFIVFNVYIELYIVSSEYVK